MVTPRSLLRSLLLIALLVYLALLLFAFFYGDRVLFQPPPSSYSASKEFLALQTRTGTAVAAVYLPNPGAYRTILYSHGNGEDLGDILPWLRVMQERGFAVLAYDYPGYGLSGGTPSEAGAVAAAEAAYDHLVNKLAVPPERIILHGYSVGGGPTLDLAVRRPVGGVVLESTFTTAYRTVTLIALLPFDRFRNIDRIREIKKPVLVIHGRKDRIVPFHHGQTLFDIAPAPKVQLWVEKGGHWDLRDEAGEAYWQAWRSFTALLPR